MVMEKLGLDNVKLQERPIPKPGPGEVLVRLRAASLNYRDLISLNGGYGSRQKTEDLIPLSDGAGEIVDLGEGVVNWKTGDRVVGCFFPAWWDGPATTANLAEDVGGMRDGVAAEYRVFAEDALLPIPDSLSFVDAATLPCAALTAWHAVRVVGGTGPEHTVLTLGTGGVSLFALQFAKMAGAQAIATSSSEAKLDRLRQLGADHVINYRHDEDWGKTARQIAGGEGVDHVVEVGGAGTLKQSMRATRIGGLITVIGVVAGLKHELNMPLIAMGSLRLTGITVGSRAQFADMLGAIGRHRLAPVIDKVFPLAELPAAFAHLQSGAHVGKVCIEIGEP